MKADRKLKVGDTGYWPTWFAKLLFTLISVKVWGLIAGTAISTWLLMIHCNHAPVVVGDQVIEYGINGTQWVTFNTTIWALIFGMKEIFRISEQREYSERAGLIENLDTQIRIAKIKKGSPKNAGENMTSVEFETVGNEPDPI